MLQGLHSLGGDRDIQGPSLTEHLWGQGVSVASPLSPYFLVLRRKTPLLHPFMQDNSPPHGPPLFSFKKEGAEQPEQRPSSFLHSPGSPQGDIPASKVCCDQPCAQGRRAEVATHTCFLAQLSGVPTQPFTTSALSYPDCFAECTQSQARPLKRDKWGKKQFKCPLLFCSSTFSIFPSHGNKSIYNFPHTDTLDTQGKHLLVRWGDPCMAAAVHGENIKHPNPSQAIKPPHQKAFAVLRKTTYLE